MTYNVFSGTLNPTHFTSRFDDTKFRALFTAVNHHYHRRRCCFIVSILPNIFGILLSFVFVILQGLGKTIQTIAFFAQLLLDGVKGPHVIIAPSSTLGMSLLVTFDTV